MSITTLYVSRYVLILKYWFKLIHTENTLLQTVYHDALYRHVNGSNNWVTNVEKLLDEYGFSYVFENPHCIHVNNFLQLFKRTVIDCFIQKWYADVSNNCKLNTLYMHIKVDFDIPHYISKLFSFQLRSGITKIRIGAHNLFIESQRYGRNRKDRHERKCILCTHQDIEDEYHFIIKCNKYEDLRKTYIPRHYYHHPSMAKFLDLLNCENKCILLKLGKYIQQATKIRNLSI